MKEIRFRVWDKERNCWVYSDVLGLDLFFANVIKGNFVNVCQYIGLKDSYASEEYYGDIIEEDNGVRRIIEDGDSAVLFKDIRTGRIKYFWQLNTHRVIGNIYETPEPLETK